MPRQKRTQAMLHDIPVSEIMTRKVVKVRPDTSIEALMSLLLDQNISGAPVVDETDRPIGMVSKTDVVRNRFEADDQRQPVRSTKVRGYDVDLGPGFQEDPLASALVRDVMVPISFTLAENAPVSRAAALMAYEGVHRLPVVSASDRVVGIVSTIDIMRWLARQFGQEAGAERREAL